MTRFLVVPQWQGSPSSRAMSLIDGAEAIAGDLPRASVTRVEVPLEAGESVDTGVQRASSLVRIHAAVADALLPFREPVITIGGDCSVSIPAVAHVADDDVAIVWFDAHPDFHTPATSPSGALAGMALRTVLGEGAPELTTRTLSPHRAVLVGARLPDDDEATAVGVSAVRTVSPEELDDPRAVVDAVIATGATRVYIHVDLDVLDPSDISGVAFAAPFGPSRTAVIAAIKAVRERFPLVGATVAGFAPASPAAAVDDLGTILRVIGALA